MAHDAAVPGLPVTIMRGGTSKGVFVRTADVPAPGPDRDRVLLDVLGSPDPMQLDGLGGTHSSTSKVVLVAPGPDGYDVEYLFGQVSVTAAAIDWSSNCGNLTTAVGPYAVDEGWVDVVEPSTHVTMLNRNTGMAIDAIVPVEQGRAAVTGDHVVAGVPRPGAPVVTRYRDPGGSLSGTLFPLGDPTSTVAVDGDPVACSVVDCVHPTVFLDPGELGLGDLGPGDLDPALLNARPEVLRRVERVRGEVGRALGLVTGLPDELTRSPAVPRLALVSAPRSGGEDVAVVAFSMGRAHHALPMTVGMCLAAAARLDGTVVHRVVRTRPDGPVAIGHPKGVTDVAARVDDRGAHVAYVEITRTARRLLSGRFLLPSALPSALPSPLPPARTAPSSRELT